ncbi:adenosylcobinamide-phosphate synthase [Alteromonas pelagimontana]|uniref:Adenosylcobinamide-phosphate synthase n=1 Tax=Alteromonas pelagimontana TaxID=1858656 RepID=A0A6M4MC38_9ALTE|nr:cobalamin biosynthesis protein [Alteromonas pelagimontana]QJR80105.1 adenosylcobinamide-phosphate synthase [Alteromonas pelagimontana]
MEALLTHSSLQTLLILLAVTAVDGIWRWPLSSHPLTLLRHLAEGMATKVRPSSQDGRTQHRISGALGAGVLIVPFVVLIAMLVYMAEYPVFFEAIIIASIIDFGHIRWRYQRVVTALGQQKKLLARDMLSHIVARDCHALSEIGIAKAAIESLLLRFHYQYCGVIIWFILAGPVAALTYRMILLFAWQWHWRRPGFLYFVQPVRNLAKVAAFLPLCFSAFLLMLVTNPSTAWRAAKRSPAKDTTSVLLALFGGGMGIRLGGPVMYHGSKYRYPRVGGPRDVRYSDLTYCQRAITRATLLLIALASLLLLLVWFINRPYGSLL